MTQSFRIFFDLLDEESREKVLERVAIKEYDGRVSREEAERQTIKEWSEKCER